MAVKLGENALKLLRHYPRVGTTNIKDLPGGELKRKRVRRGRKKGGQCGRGTKGQGQRMTLPRIGFEGGNTPFYLRIPQEPYYKGHHVRREYPPLSLHTLQRMIDMGRINPDEPIDLNTICRTKLLEINAMDKEYGFNLTDEGSDSFQAQVNIEVQWTNEATIAAVERNGGVITTRYFPITCVDVMANPLKFFRKGLPIPKCSVPPEDAMEYYTDPNSRGYLADPDEVAEARFMLSQKYGYKLPDLIKDPKFDMLLQRKDPRQMFFGLWPGWVVCMKDKVIIKPKDEKYKRFYMS